MKAYSAPNIVPGLVVKSWLKHGALSWETYDLEGGAWTMIIYKFKDTEASHPQKIEENFQARLDL